MENHFSLFEAKMRKADLSENIIGAFKYSYELLLSGHQGYITEDDITPVKIGDLPRSAKLSEFGALGRENMPRLVRIILNGGLGTSMGLLGPKSLLRVKNGMSFLEIILRQAEAQGTHLAFMNSFGTERETIAALEKLKPSIRPYHFLQNRFPKVSQADLKPARSHKNPHLEWNPPGHGDIYTAVYASGLLDELLSQGIKYAFASNVDNLRAHVNPDILGYFVSRDIPFMMEVAPKTPNDVKGGHLAYNKAGGFILREVAQCTENDLPYFYDMEKYPFFNTNNIWLNLEQIYAFMGKHKYMPMPIIVNAKTLDPRDSGTPGVYQIESAIGAAIGVFENAAALHVPRSHLLAVKTCNDLLTVRSDCYKMTVNSEIYMNPERIQNFGESRPVVNLDPAYFKLIDDFEARFANMPSLLECGSLEVKGDFHFGEDVVVKGDVKLVNNTSVQVAIAPNTVLEGEYIYG